MRWGAASLRTPRGFSAASSTSATSSHRENKRTGSTPGQWKRTYLHQRYIVEIQVFVETLVNHEMADFQFIAARRDERGTNAHRYRRWFVLRSARHISKTTLETQAGPLAGSRESRCENKKRMGELKGKHY